MTCYYRAMWMSVFHAFVIPFLGAMALTLGKLIADGKLISFDQANDTALDMVLLSVGALVAFYVEGRGVARTVDAGVMDAFLAALLLYVRFRRERLKQEAFAGGRFPSRVGWISGSLQLIVGALSIVWTVGAF